jgi:hypothetical protein
VGERFSRAGGVAGGKSCSLEELQVRPAVEREKLRYTKGRTTVRLKNGLSAGTDIDGLRRGAKAAGLVLGPAAGPAVRVMLA